MKLDVIIMFVSIDPSDPNSATKAMLATRWFYSKTKKERLEIIRKLKNGSCLT